MGYGENANRSGRNTPGTSACPYPAGGAIRSAMSGAVNTVSALQASGAQVVARCDECGAAERVDLGRMLRDGGDLDLTDRHPPCRRCDYWLRFYAVTGQRTRALTTADGDAAESRRRTAWLFSGAPGRPRGSDVHARSPDPAGADPAPRRTRR